MSHHHDDSPAMVRLTKAAAYIQSDLRSPLAPLQHALFIVEVREAATANRPVMGHPTPMPIVEALLALGRLPLPVSRSEAWFLDSPHVREMVRWPENYPRTIPMAARLLMTEMRIGWVGSLSEAQQIEILNKIAASPAAHGDLLFELNRNAEKLSPAVIRHAAEIVAGHALCGPFSALQLIVLACFAMSALRDDQVLGLLNTDAFLIHEPGWRPYAAAEIARAAEEHDRMDLWQAGVRALLAMVGDETLDLTVRKNALLGAIQRCRPSRWRRVLPLTRDVLAAANDPALRREVEVRRGTKQLKAEIHAFEGES